jgi:hypothetical protein
MFLIRFSHNEGELLYTAKCYITVCKCFIIHTFQKSILKVRFAPFECYREFLVSMNMEDRRSVLLLSYSHTDSPVPVIDVVPV